MKNIFYTLTLSFTALLLFVVPMEAMAWSTPYTQAPTVFSNLYGTTHGGNWCGAGMCPRNVYVDYYPMLTDGTSNTSLIPGSVVTVDASFQTTRFEIYPGQTNYFFGNCTNGNASANIYYFYTYLVINGNVLPAPPIFCVQSPGFDPGAWGSPYGILGTYGHPTNIYNPSGYQSAYPTYTVAVITPTPTITSSNPAVISCPAGTSCTSQSVGSATLTVTYPATYSEEYEAWCWGSPGCGYIFSHTLPGGSYYYGPHAIVPATSVSFLATVNPAANPPPTITFLNAQQNTIPVNTSASLFWNTSGVGAITCNGTSVPANALWNGPRTTTFFGSGFTTSPLAADTTFTLTCSSVWGSDTKSRTVTVVSPNTSATPTITGPTTLTAGINGTYSFTATDPQGDQVRYGIDWNMDGVADEWLPAGVTYVNSGTSQSTTHNWGTAGVKTFQALTQDFQGLNSVWVPYTVNVVAPAACTLPWGGSIASGNSTVAYQASSVMSPLTCVSQSRLCTNGTFDGTYTNQSCSVTPAVCVLPWGGSIASGNSVPAYQTSTVTSPTVCVSEPRLCTNGTLSGTYINQSCVVSPAAVCPNTICEGTRGETPLTCPQDCKVRYQQF